MTDSEIRAFLAVALMAALADGANDERERSALKALAGRLSEGRIDLADVYDDVLVRKTSIADAVRPLTTAEARRQAYETAVAVADADGVHSPAEAGFLDELAAALGLPAPEAREHLAQADAVAAASGVGAAGGGEPVREVQGHVMPDVAALDDKIVRASVTNAALELLPESLASMAILPLQVRLVYQIGKAYGYELDQGHIKEFIATLASGSQDSTSSNSVASCSADCSGGARRRRQRRGPPGGKLRDGVRDDVGARPARKAVLRGRSHAGHREAQGRLRAAA
jgi:tellurite resistance protein